VFRLFDLYFKIQRLSTQHSRIFPRTVRGASGYRSMSCLPRRWPGETLDVLPTINTDNAEKSPQFWALIELFGFSVIYLPEKGSGAGTDFSIFIFFSPIWNKKATK